MPCEKPVISPISDECCFSCFTTGRGTYTAPIAIVLHEVDEHIEALNNRLENCCHDKPDCHSSFHYGVGDSGTIINWVDPANTAWSFDPVNSDMNCGTCGWSIATQEGAGVDPNTYTINIAVSTGILAFDQSSPNSLAQNNYTEEQYNALVRLTGWLAETYGITVNQNNIWRHCGELDDFPAGCSCPPNRYDEFLTDVQNCINTIDLVAPWLCDVLCDSPLIPGNPAFILGIDPECNLCGRYALPTGGTGDICAGLAALPAATDCASGFSLITAACELYTLPPNPDPTLCDPATPSACHALVMNAGACPTFGPVRGTMGHRMLAVDSTVVTNDGQVIVDTNAGDVTITLTPPVGCECLDVCVKNAGTNCVLVLDPNNTIDGLPSYVCRPGAGGAYGDNICFYWTGSEWIII